MQKRALLNIETSLKTGKNVPHKAKMVNKDSKAI